MLRIMNGKRASPNDISSRGHGRRRKTIVGKIAKVGGRLLSILPRFTVTYRYMLDGRFGHQVPIRAIILEVSESH